MLSSADIPSAIWSIMKVWIVAIPAVMLAACGSREVQKFGPLRVGAASPQQEVPYVEGYHIKGWICGKETILQSSRAIPQKCSEAPSYNVSYSDGRRTYFVEVEQHGIAKIVQEHSDMWP